MYLNFHSFNERPKKQNIKLKGSFANYVQYFMHFQISPNTSYQNKSGCSQNISAVLVADMRYVGFDLQKKEKIWDKSGKKKTCI